MSDGKLRFDKKLGETARFAYMTTIGMCTVYIEMNESEHKTYIANKIKSNFMKYSLILYGIYDGR